MRSLRLSFSWTIVFAVVGMLTVSGCDSRPKRVRISGRIMIDGEPLETGVVQFMPTGTRPSYGKIENGQFTMQCYDDNDGVIVGRHVVTINASEIISTSKIKWYAPKKYSDPKKSGISMDIEKPNDDLVIEITWDGGKPYIEKTSRQTVDEGDADDV